MTITALPTPPSRSDPVNFAARGDALLGALPTLVTEMNAATAEVDADRAAAAVSASAALVSQNVAATSASNAAISRAAAASSESAALAAAAATQAGLPAQSGTNGLFLRSASGVATWAYQQGPVTQIAYSAPSENQLGSSSAKSLSAWSLGANTGVLLGQSLSGPNGLRYVLVFHSSLTDAHVGWSHTPVQGQTKTASVWWRGTSKPTTGNLIFALYRDAGNATQIASLPFSDPSIIADGVARRYSVTFTHAGSDVSPIGLFFLLSCGTDPGGYFFADPMLNVGATAADYVATGAEHILDGVQGYDVDSSAGAVRLYLPAPGFGAQVGAWAAIKDAGRSAATNNITVDRNSSQIEGSNQDIEIDINGAAIELVSSQRKGWLIK